VEFWVGGLSWLAGRCQGPGVVPVLWGCLDFGVGPVYEGIRVGKAGGSAV
jgi:hypothetical protein